MLTVSLGLGTLALFICLLKPCLKSTSHCLARLFNNRKKTVISPPQLSMPVMPEIQITIQKN